MFRCGAANIFFEGECFSSFGYTVMGRKNRPKITKWYVYFAPAAPEEAEVAFYARSEQVGPPAVPARRAANV